MTGEAGAFGEVVYPPACAAECHLGPRALRLVGGVLGRNCHGPAPFHTDGIVRVFEIAGDQARVVSPTEEDLDEKVCTNPRVVNAIRTLLHEKIDDLDITSVKMGE